MADVDDNVNNLPPTTAGDMISVLKLSQKIQFTDNSTEATRITWSFGDGETSTERNPTHTYYSNGDFTVIFTGTNQYGSSSTTKIVTITEVGTITGDTEEEGETEDSNIEPKPTSPPNGFNYMTNPMTGTLSPQGQWSWNGVSITWVAVETEEESSEPVATNTPDDIINFGAGGGNY